MLKFLFGNKNIERILIYLLVNEKCYAHQIHRMLNIPLTPIQKALNRLEEGEVIKSQTEGKIRIYQFNPAYPVINELEMLLKKAFHTLPPHEKKHYYYLEQAQRNNRKQQNELIELIWNQLKNISRVTMIAKSRSKQTGWSGKGNGEVNVVEENHALIIYEQGQWKDTRGQMHKYSNCFRWTLNRIDGMLSLEHLRLGKNHPVFLFHLIATEENRLISLHSHLCGEDSYFGWVQYNELFLQLNFRVIGTKKNEELEYIYT